ncbi:DUF4062 domain-containing protein [Myroides profundi]|uniref:DUF4062 domain-containing protein n=1 Tax=Myroides profundi TaxID=480520 RepID=A0AAJ4W4A6_MYRPR|nr:DUF4062 domain-containing protein [Myroides profundi]AJH14500.1 hypothetical protein MPR_1318 [Myroides profundi]SEQ94672.1 protein of unknown function [Myroides profundi]
MDKKYQVFVSSTYTDLLEERQEIMHALLELDCIPAGMELFPASNEDQWSLIKGVIDDSDYYIVIVGGRYGSLGSEGVSYTEMEYRYALESGKPIIAFLHKDPESIPKKHTEKTTEGQQKLDDFKLIVQQKMCKYWATPQELGSVVSRSLISLQKKFPGIGWIRGNVVSSSEANIEILKLKKEIETLQNKLNEARTKAPDGSEKFAQGSTEVELSFSIKYGDYRSSARNYNRKFTTNWNEIFYWISPSMIDELSEEQFKASIDKFVYNKTYAKIIKEETFTDGGNFYSYALFESDYQTIKVQLRALGLITKSNKSRSIKDNGTYWSLTPFGDEVMTRLRAIKA